MRKSDRLGLLIRNKVLKLAAWYLTMVLSGQAIGTVQDILNYKAIKQYKEVVNDFGEFLSSNGIDDPIQIFDYYNYALWGGYLSKDHNFQFNTERDLFFSSYGLGCILGNSVCLNNAGMLSDLYESMGMDSDVVMCYVPIGKTRIDNIRGQEDITRNVAETVGNNAGSSSMPIVANPITFLVGNHAVTAVSYNGERLYFDPTNLAYLFKSDFDNLDIVNGEGTFKRRNLTTLLFEVDSAIKYLFESNEEDYDLEYLNNYEDTDIDILKLEEFYNSEKETIDEIYDLLKGKSQNLLRALAFLIVAILIISGVLAVEKVVKFKRKKNEDKLKYLISLFMMENGIEKFEEVCHYLYYLINLGCLSCDEDNLKIKRRVCFTSSDFVTFDKDKYGKQFFYEYMKSKFSKVEEILGREYECGVYDTFYVFHSDDGYRFYSFKNNLMYQINDACQLVSQCDEYEMFKLFKKKYLQSAPVEECDVSFAKLDEFYENNKDTIEEIAKTYTYVPKK